MPYLEGRHCHSYIPERGQARRATAPLNQNFQQGSKDEPCLILAFPLFCRCTKQGHLLSSPPQSSSLWRSTLCCSQLCQGQLLSPTTFEAPLEVLTNNLDVKVLLASPMSPTSLCPGGFVVCAPAQTARFLQCVFLEFWQKLVQP